MEKSSKIILDPEQMDIFNSGLLPAGIIQKYDIHTREDLKKVIDAGEFEISSPSSKPITDGQ